MIKKLAFFLLVCMPFVSGAAPVYYNPGTGNAVGADGSLTGLDTTADSVVVESGKGIVVGANGITVSENIYIGLNYSGDDSGQLYVESGVDSPFTILSGGAVNVAGSLNVLSGYTLNLGGNPSPISASFGSISNLGTLTIYNISTLTTGAVSTSGDMSLSADIINAGAIINDSGNTNISATGALTMASFVSNSSGLSSISGDSISSGDIQNVNALGKMNILAGSSLTSTGSIWNSGTKMNICGAIDGNGNCTAAGGGITVAGTMKNDSTSGTMILNVASLTVNGGDAANISFVNSGDLYAVVSGDTYLEYGFDLSTMTNSNVFSWETGTLTFGSNMPADQFLQLFSNGLSQFSLTINNGAISVNNIINGVGNASANMNLKATSINAASVQNTGNQLNMNATDSAGGIYISGGVGNNLNSVANIVSAGALNVVGAVNNSGAMVLNGKTVDLYSIANDGDLQVLGLNDASGSIKITSDITNAAGTIFVNAREIDIDGTLKNNGGTTTISGSDTSGGSVSIGGINAAGGVINLDSLIGSISVGSGISAVGGSLNFSANTKSITAGDSINISGDLTLSPTAASGAGNVNIAASGSPRFEMKSTGGNINIDGDISAVMNDLSRTVMLDSALINIGGDVIADGKGAIIFGDSLAINLTVDGNVVSNNGGLIDLDVASADVRSLSGSGKFIARGQIINATANAFSGIDIENGIWFDGSDPLSGLVVKDTNDLTLSAENSGITVAGGISIGAGNNLSLITSSLVSISGAVGVDGVLNIDSGNDVSFSDDITVGGALNISADYYITTAGLTNTGTVNLTSVGGKIVGLGIVANSGDMTISGGIINVSAISSSAGSLEIVASNSFNSSSSMYITGGYANLYANRIEAVSEILVSGDMTQGGTSGMMNLKSNSIELSTNKFTINGDFDAVSGSADYMVSSDFSAGNINIESAATVRITSNAIDADDVANRGNLSLAAADIKLGDVSNYGDLEMSASNGLNLNNFTTSAGSAATMYGDSMNSAGAVSLAGLLLQNFGGTVDSGALNVWSDDFVLTAASVAAAGISQTSGAMLINTSDLDIAGNIIASDLRIAAQGTDWLAANIAGNVSGGVEFIGLETMSIGGNYIFDDSSMLHAAILPRATSPYNYYSTVSLADDGNLGKIINGVNAEPLISINGKFISNISESNPNMLYDWDTATIGALEESQIGIDIFDIVDQGTAIWLLHADGGVEENGKKIRNASVRFCNAAGTVCYNYLDSIGNGSSDDDDLPAYISMRDADGDGEADSLYIVFDPRFGGPVEVFKIQPIVGREEDHTDGEYSTAGALDDLIDGKLHQTGFYNRTPIEVIPLVFENSNMQELAKELYDRMEQYVLDQDGAGLARFSRLFQPREIEQIIGSIALNEHANFRDFESLMIDEFIWNRNRNLNKVWLDADFGKFNQSISDNKKISGDRFSIHGGFDWQESETLILGLAGRVSHVSDSSFDEIDLGYKSGQNVAGRVKADVADTNIGIGGYLMKTLGAQARLYGNAFLDMHLLDVSREQNFVDPIKGSGTAFSIISEWGLLHDWLNQYIVGNLYVRAGYNFGFSVAENAGGGGYMNLESDGYFVLTPGYSLVAQKRIYPSSWFQIRPNISIGAEYDLLGMPDDVQFKFAPATKFTDYKAAIDSLWLYAGGGLEFLSASGIHAGINYRYQYNQDITMHKVGLSMMYRF
ncbi:MAG: hypothetical protein LBD50_02365 [Rickettsiales bacterium]|jgi:hypothetical protein|nr:hypothetical protein [Rickettsiales bacterium]